MCPVATNFLVNCERNQRQELWALSPRDSLLESFAPPATPANPGAPHRVESRRSHATDSMQLREGITKRRQKVGQGQAGSQCAAPCLEIITRDVSSVIQSWREKSAEAIVDQNLPK